MVQFDDSMAFNLLWFDEMAASDRPFRLIFYPMDNSIEIIDMKTGKLHLRRIRNFDVSKESLFVGNKLVIYGRHYRITEFADQATKKSNVTSQDKSFVLIKPDAYIHMGKILQDISGLGFQIARIQMARLSEKDVQTIYSEHVGRPYFPALARHMMSDVTVGFEVAGPDALNVMQLVAGPTNPVQAKQQAPQSWRAKYGTEGVKNGVHISQTQEAYHRESHYYFSDQVRIGGFTALLNNCTLCLIKPHIVASGQAGQIIDRVLDEGFEISALTSCYLERRQAEDFLDLYRGVISDFNMSVDQLVSGLCIALEVRQENVVDTFKQICGCYDPMMGKTRKGETDTIRAMFGIDKHKNAVHCTDLPEDAQLECEFFFVLVPEESRPKN